MFLQQCKHFSNACFFYRRLGSSVPVLCHFQFPPVARGVASGGRGTKIIRTHKEGRPGPMRRYVPGRGPRFVRALAPKNSRVGYLVMSWVVEWIATRRKDLPPGRPISNKFRYEGAPDFSLLVWNPSDNLLRVLGKLGVTFEGHQRVQKSGRR